MDETEQNEATEIIADKTPKRDYKFTKKTTLDICITAVLTALVFVMTFWVQLRLPISVNGGLIHLGNVPLFVAALVFGKKKAAFAGGVGMGLFDVLSGWALWSPFTLVIRAAMGFVIGLIAEKKGGKNIVLFVLAIVIGSIIDIVGYYFTEVILYQNWVAPFTSIPGNLIQLAAGAVIGIPLSVLLLKRKEIINKLRT